MSNYFSNFTNLFSLTKTLRFELKPTPETEELLKKNNVIKIDSEIAELYKNEMKPLLDQLHLKFINEALGRTHLEEELLKTINSSYLELKELQKNRKENRDKIDKKQAELFDYQRGLRELIVGQFNKLGDEWKVLYKLKGNGYKVLTESGILKVLKQLYPDKLNAIERFDKFFGYFDGFSQNRENYYSSENKSTGVANRIVNENLIRYLDSVYNFELARKEINHLQEYSKYFSIEQYSNYLTQDGVNFYNSIVGGEINEKGEKVSQGINEKINLYNQKNKTKLQKLKVLYKQIGSEKKSLDILTIEPGQEWEKLSEFLSIHNKPLNLDGKEENMMPLIENLFNSFFTDIINFDLSKIYFNKVSINTISNYWFSNWMTLVQKLKEMKVFKLDKDEFKIPQQVTLAEIKQALSELNDQNPSSIFKEQYKEKNLFSENLWQTFLNIWEWEIKEKFRKLDDLMQEFTILEKKSFDKKKHTVFIKDFCDTLLSIERMLKYHTVKEEVEKNSRFYDVVDLYFQESQLDKYYNAFRNYISKKPYSEDKIKLNFEKGNLLGGWPDSPEGNTQYNGFIFTDKTNYYLGISSNPRILDVKKFPDAYRTGSGFYKMVYKQLDGKTIYGSSYIGKFGSKYESDKKLLNDAELISRIKQILQEKQSYFPELKEIINKNYKKAVELARDISDRALYNIQFVPVSEPFIRNLAKSSNGPLMYLFKIHNQDFVRTDKYTNKNEARENIHTTYFKHLFSNENLKLKILKLSGGAEIFFRPKTEGLPERKDLSGKKVLQNRRYSENKFFLHIPIDINMTKKPKIKSFNQILNKGIFDTDIHILGIDRGEKHLLYYSVINTKGEIIEQGSFNHIETKTPVDEKQLKCVYEKGEIKSVELVSTGKKINYVDYHLLLDYYEKKRILARKSWETVGKIKDLKEGYLSQIIHKIYQLVIEYNAVIVLEDLNTEFKAKRTAKVEKAVYKKFELALAKKLNHLVLKDKLPEELGGILKAYQLTPPIDKVSYFEKAKQWGILFYVRANYTSTTDPLTGWRKHLYISNSASVPAIKEFFNPENGVKIFFSNEHNAFAFKYTNPNTQKPCTLIARKGLERFNYDRVTRFNKKIDLHTEFVELFSKVDIKKNINLQILEIENFRWKSLVFLWNLLNQIRNTDRNEKGNDGDFIQSPVSPFFDSRNIKDKSQPENGDANGAFNTARKGLMLLNRIKTNPERYEQLIRDSEWDEWASQE